MFQPASILLALFAVTVNCQFVFTNPPNSGPEPVWQTGTYQTAEWTATYPTELSIISVGLDSSGNPVDVYFNNGKRQKPKKLSLQIFFFSKTHHF